MDNTGCDVICIVYGRFIRSHQACIHLQKDSPDGWEVTSDDRAVDYIIRAHTWYLHTRLLPSLPQAPWNIEDKNPPEDWPSRGEVEFSNYSVRYRPGLDLVLKNLSMSVKGGEKVIIRLLCYRPPLTGCIVEVNDFVNLVISVNRSESSEGRERENLP